MEIRIGVDNSIDLKKTKMQSQLKTQSNSLEKINIKVLQKDGEHSNELGLTAIVLVLGLCILISSNIMKIYFA